MWVPVRYRLRLALCHNCSLCSFSLFDEHLRCGSEYACWLCTMVRHRWFRRFNKGELPWPKPKAVQYPFVTFFCQLTTLCTTTRHTANICCSVLALSLAHCPQLGAICRLWKTCSYAVTWTLRPSCWLVIHWNSSNQLTLFSRVKNRNLGDQLINGTIPKSWGALQTLTAL